MEKVKFKLVPYCIKDYNFVYNIKKISYEKYVTECFGEWNEEKQQQMFEDYINQNKNYIKITVVDGKQAGIVDGKVVDENTYEQGNICLLPEFQGQGIGSAYLKNILIAHKNKNVYLRVFKQNPAQNLYKRLGFEICGETKSHYNMVMEAHI